MKLSLFALISIFLLPALVFSATTDFVAGSDITVSGVTFGVTTADMLILNGSSAESWTFNGGAFTVVNPDSTAVFKVGSSDSTVKSIQITQGASTLVCTENATPGTSFATLPTSAGTYTISPSATVACTSLCTTLSNTATYNVFPTCGAATCNVGYALSGSGASATCVQSGGGGIFTGTFTNVPKPKLQTIYPDGTIVYYDDTVVNNPPPVSVQKPKTVNSLPAPSFGEALYFSRTLKIGMKNADVRILQLLFASDASIYPDGLITGYFGQLTEDAVKRFQVKYGIVSSGTAETTGYGVVGPKTQAKLKEVFGNVATTPLNTNTTLQRVEVNNSTSFKSFSISLKKNMSRIEVKYLQQILNNDKETELSETGVGSQGNETTFFGQLTEDAVKRFQVKYGIVSSGTPQTTGYGVVGPKTRVKLNELRPR